MLNIYSINLYSQIKSENLLKKNYSPRFKSNKEPQNFKVNTDIIKSLEKQDSIDSKFGAPFRFGKSIKANIDFIKTSYSVISSDTLFKYLEIKSENAFSINLIFDEIELSNSAYLRIYNNDLTYVYGPIMKNDIPANGIFWTDLIKGNHIIIEIIEPNLKSINKLHISQVIHGYKDTFTPNNFGDSNSCNIDINCPQGNGWSNESGAVAMILLDAGTRWCTGSLINNTAKDFRAFFLTAFHCLDMDNSSDLNVTERNNVSNWLFRFGYESVSCGGSEGTNFVTFNGANFRAAFQPTDMALLELTNRPIADFIRYAGWDRSSNPATSGTGIHHPSGDVKKISIDNNSLTSNPTTINWTGGTTSPPNSHWVVGFDQGTTEGGSSGSPIFDQNHRIVGQLHGGANGCAPVTKNYGRLDLSWTGGLTNDTRLSNWLDPCNLGNVTLNTEVPIIEIQGPSQFCNSQNYTIPNLSIGSTVTWSVSGGLTINGSNTANPVNIVKSISGTGVLSATISSNCAPYTISKTIQTPYVVYPIEHREGTYQFCAGSFTNDFFVQESPNASDYTWSISPVPYSYNIINNSRSEVTVIINNPGTYMLNVAVTTECGIAYNQTQITVLSSYECGGGGFERFSYYPNPASTTLTIDYAVSSNENIENKSDKQIKLFDDKGTLVKTSNLDKAKNKIILDIADLPNGTYYLHVSEGKETIKKQIIIKH